MGDAVAVTDKDVLIVDMIGSTMTCCLKGFLVAFQKEITTTVAHVDAIAVEIRTIDCLAAAYCHTVVALGALATIVPGDKEIVISCVFEDKWSFDCIRAGEVGCGILRRIGIDGERSLRIAVVQIIASGDSTGLFALGYLHRGVELYELDTIPERAPHKPRLIVVINDEIRIDGIPVVASLTRADNGTLILPDGERERTVGE